MRRIPLRTRGEPPDQLVWAEVIQQIVRRPLDPQKGADVEELRRGIRIFDALDRANGGLELEDADYEHLNQKTLAMPWGVIDRRLLEFIEDVQNAPEA